MKTFVSIPLIAAALVIGQSADKKASPPAKPDTWQKSKDCASQAEKVVADWPRRTGSAPAEWRNHYSPKYDKCFIWLYLLNVSKDEKVFPTMFSTALWDAFERSPLANFCEVPSGMDCEKRMLKFWQETALNEASLRLNGKPFADASPAEQDTARASAITPPAFTYCQIGDKSEDCAAVSRFISEHMKN